MSLESDANLLLAVLALQMKFIDRDELVAALNQWYERPAQSMGEVLVQRGKLGEGEHAFLMLAVQKQLDARADADTPNLDAVGTVVQSSRDEFPSSESGPDGTPNAFAAATEIPPTVRSADDLLGRPSTEGHRFRILQEHAMGGLGQVFLARDEELNREVALKQIRPQLADDADLRARFVLEAQITGGLEHPGIVPVYGLGCDATGRPFYAMRFIRGDSLKDAIQRFHAAAAAGSDAAADGLALRRLLGCFVQVCNTVAYAHSRGVIHRDLKPENVMLGPYAETLLVDWGLAKIVGHESKPRPAAETQATLRPPAAGVSAPTQLGAAVGTLAYMSPEQAAGLVDELGPGSDIYSLGSTLYAILAGRPPISGKTSQEMREKIILGNIVPPRKIDPRIPAPLDAICLKAMARVPAERYQSAQELAGEIEAWLADQPVRAWPEPWPVRLRRWRKRHRALVVGAGVAVLVTLVSLSIGVVLLTAANDRVRGARNLAEQRAAEARQNFQLARQSVDKYLTQVSEDARLKSHDLENLRRDLLVTAQQFYQRLIEQAPGDAELQEEQIWAYFRLAEITRQMGDKQQSTQLLEKAYAGFAALAQAHPDNDNYQSGLAKCRTNLGLLYRENGQLDEAMAALQEAFTIQTALVGRHPEIPGYQIDLARIHQNLAGLHIDAKRIPAAEEAYRAAIKIRRELVRQRPDDALLQADLAAAQCDLGLLYHVSHRPDEAAAALNDARTIQQRLVDKDPTVPLYQSDLATTDSNLGLLYADLPQQAAAAEKSYQDALAIRRRLVRQHPSITQYQQDLARTHNNLATWYCEQGRMLEAEGAYKAAREIHEHLAEEQPTAPEYKNDLASTLNNLANLYGDTDRTEDAAAMYRAAIKIRRELADSYSGNADYQSDLATTYGNLGALLTQKDRLPEAEKEYLSSLEILENLVRTHPHVGAYAVDLAAGEASLGHLLCDLGRGPAALESCRKALEVLHLHQEETAAAAKADDVRRNAHWGCAKAFNLLGKPKDALAEWDAALQLNPGAARDLLRLGRVESLVQIGDHKQAVEETKALLLAAQGFGPILYRMSALCARAAAAAAKDPALAPAERTRLADEEAAIAIDILRQAKAASYFDAPEARKQLKEDPAIESLRARDDFRRFVEPLNPTPP
jgi:serine/threonine-protein kinase